jgi:hypothetical protein
LKDVSHIQQYTTYDRRTPGDQTADVYSRYTIVTTREGDNPKIRATIQFEDGTSSQIDDMKRESEIEASTLNAVSTYLKNGGVIDTKVMSSFFLKRAGDWCQALCLLDKSRKYSVFDITSKDPLRETTLQQLEDQNAEVMLMTHDRILLTYGLTLGLNAMYTNSRGGDHWMVYFKNIDMFRIDDGSDVLATAEAHKQTLKTEKVRSEGFITNAMEAIKGTSPDTGEAIMTLRSIYAKLVSLPKPLTIQQRLTDLETAIGAIDKDYLNELLTNNILTLDGIEDRERAKQLSDSLVKLRNMLPVIDTTFKLIENSLDVSRYPGMEDDQQTIKDFNWVLENKKPFKQSHIHPDKRTINLEAEVTVMASRLADDAYTLYSDSAFTEEQRDIFVGIPFPGDESWNAMSRIISNIYRSFYDIFIKKFENKRKVYGAQTGGSIDTYFLPQAIYLMTQTQLPTEGDYYIDIGQEFADYDGWKYFVVDNYIVTKDLKPTLLGALHTFGNIQNSLSNGDELTRPYIHVIILRLLFLMVDEIKNQTDVLQSVVIETQEPEFDDELINDTNAILNAKLTGIMAAINEYEGTGDFNEIDLIISQIENITVEDALNIPFLGQDVIVEIRQKLMDLYLNGIAGRFMRAVYESERKAQQESGEETQVVVFLDPRTNDEHPFPPNELVTGVSIAGPQWTFTFTNVDPSVETVYQNIATGVLVPLLPQPTAPTQWGSNGGLRKRRSLYSNAGQTPLVNVDGASNDERLRKRTGPSITRRVRKSTRSTRRRR